MGGQTTIEGIGTPPRQRSDIPRPQDRGGGLNRHRPDCSETPTDKRTHETEVKLAAAGRRDLRRLARRSRVGRFALGNARIAHLRTIYLDDPGLILARRGVALRVRRHPAGWEMTAKWSGHSEGDLHVRPEINVPLSSEPRPPYPLPPGPLTDRLGDIVRQCRLAPVVVTDIERETLDIRDSGKLIAELALDCVRHSAPRVSAPSRPYFEVEVELLSGSPAALLEFAQLLKSEFGLLPTAGSKYSRALEDLHGIRLDDLIGSAAKDSIG